MENFMNYSIFNSNEAHQTKGVVGELRLESLVGEVLDTLIKSDGYSSNDIVIGTNDYFFYNKKILETYKNGKYLSGKNHLFSQYMTSLEIDHLLISKKGILLLDSKNHSNYSYSSSDLEKLFVKRTIIRLILIRVLVYLDNHNLLDLLDTKIENNTLPKLISKLENDGGLVHKSRSILDLSNRTTVGMIVTNKFERITKKGMITSYTNFKDVLTIYFRSEKNIFTTTEYEILKLAYRYLRDYNSSLFMLFHSYNYKNISNENKLSWHDFLILNKNILDNDMLDLIISVLELSEVKQLALQKLLD